MNLLLTIIRIGLPVFIVSVALAGKHDNVHVAWPSPLPFYYKPDEPYDYMYVDIILQNVPPEATRYVLYSQTDNCDRTIKERSAGCNEPVKNEPIPTNKRITILQKLNKRNVRIYIEIQKKNNKLCAMKTIMDGATDINAQENQFNQDCLNKKWDLCEINVDFQNRCEETRAKINFSQDEGRLVCKVSDDVTIPEDAIHQWYQTTKDKTPIGTIPTVKGSKTEFRMTIYKFDSNTYISSVMRSSYWLKDLLTERSKVPSPNNGYENYVVKHKTKCTANEQVTFSCSNYEPSQIGWIEPTGFQITTYNRLTYTWRFIKEQNGTMLCCLDYHTKTVGKKTVVERKVTNITLFIYEEPVHQDNVKGTTESTEAGTNSSDKSLAPNSNTNDKSLAPNNKTKDESLASNSNTYDESLAPKNNTNEDALAPNSNTNEEALAPNSNTNDDSLAPKNNTNDESPIPSNKTSDEFPAPSNKTKDESSVTAGLLIGLAVVMGVAATVGCIVIIYRKKSCCVKSIPEEPSQIYLAHDPFYVNLLFRKECQAEIEAAENFYEEIN